MRLACVLVCLVAACDPQLSMSGPKQEKRTTAECPEAVAHLRECCPAYESYLSCIYYDSWAGGSSDLSERQSRCLQKQPCEAIDKGVTAGKDVCGITFSGHRCRL